MKHAQGPCQSPVEDSGIQALPRLYARGGRVGRSQGESVSQTQLLKFANSKLSEDPILTVYEGPFQSASLDQA